MSCDLCPAAFVIEGVAPGERAVLCRVESTSRGQRSASAGPVSVVRERESPAALHGFCLGDLPAYVEEIVEAGALANDQQRQIAAAAAASAARPSYRDCPSWQAETTNRMTAKLVDQPGERRVLGGA